MRTEKRIDALIGASLALAAFAAYIPTVSHKVGPEDAGELAASVATLGVAHPTGYPLFSLFGRIVATLTPDGVRIITALNFTGAVLCALAVFLFYQLFLLLLGPHPFGTGGGKRFWETPAQRGTGSGMEDAHPPSIRRIAAATGALVLGFSRTVWANATSFEVYALHLVFLALTLLLFARAVRAHAEGEPSANRRWLLFVYVLGLSFSHHMMTVLLGPALLYVYFATHGLGRTAWLKIARAVPVFALALTSYLYLPIRASTNPMLNWSDPSDWYGFREHLTGAMFQSQMFSSTNLMASKAMAFFAALPENFGYLPLLLALVGAWYAARASRRIAAFVGILFATSLLYSFSYDFNDPNYNLNAMAVLALWCARGVVGLFVRLGHLVPSQYRIRFGCGVFIAVILSVLPLHSRAEANKGDDAVDDYAVAVLNSLDSNATLVTGDYHNVCAPALYLQTIERIRRDVRVLCQPFLNQPWYYNQLEAMYPEFVSSPNGELKSLIEKRRVTKELMANGFQFLVLNRASWKPFYFCQQLSALRQDGYHIVPQNMALRVFPDSVPASYAPAMPDMRIVQGAGRYAQNIREIQVRTFLTYAAFYDERGRVDKVVDALQKALQYNPDMPNAREWLKARRGY